MAPHNSGTVTALCVHRGSCRRSEEQSWESAKSILAARRDRFQSQVTPFSLSSFDCRLRSYCRKQRGGGAGIVNINELNPLAWGWAGAGMKRRYVKKILKMMIPRWAFLTSYSSDLLAASLLRALMSTTAWTKINSHPFSPMISKHSAGFMGRCDYSRIFFPL